MNLKDTLRLNELFDLYGSLLSANQREITSQFLEYNLSFTEIAENRSTSRQSSFITLKLCIKKLESYEQKLGLLKIKNEIKNSISLLENNKIKEAIKTLKKL